MDNNLLIVGAALWALITVVLIICLLALKTGKPTTYMHVKTSGLYEVMGVGFIESDMSVCVIYRGTIAGQDTIFVRPYNEFIDGRFIHVSGPIVQTPQLPKRKRHEQR